MTLWKQGPDHTHLVSLVRNLFFIRSVRDFYSKCSGEAMKDCDMIQFLSFVRIINRLLGGNSKLGKMMMA